MGTRSRALHCDKRTPHSSNRLDIGEPHPTRLAIAACGRAHVRMAQDSLNNHVARPGDRDCFPGLGGKCASRDTPVSPHRAGIRARLTRDPLPKPDRRRSDLVQAASPAEADDSCCALFLFRLRRLGPSVAISQPVHFQPAEELPELALRLGKVSTKTTFFTGSSSYMVNMGSLSPSRTD